MFASELDQIYNLFHGHYFWGYLFHISSGNINNSNTVTAIPFQNCTNLNNWTLMSYTNNRKKEKKENIWIVMEFWFRIWIPCKLKLWVIQVSADIEVSLSKKPCGLQQDRQ